MNLLGVDVQADALSDLYLALTSKEWESHIAPLLRGALEHVRRANDTATIEKFAENKGKIRILKEILALPEVTRPKP